MTKQFEVYKCAHCGNIVEVVHGGGASLVCCGEKMKLLAEGTSDGSEGKARSRAGKDRHRLKVSVGSVAHPMEEAHYIEWIELLADGRSYKKYLNPGEKPEAEFCIDAAHVTAREYAICMVSGRPKPSFSETAPRL